MIAILDYEAGNLTSVDLAVKHVGGDAVVTQDPLVVARAERVIFPGVGSAAACMGNLRRFKLDESLRTAVHEGVPVLAICIGQQLLFDHSEEDGGTDCLGVFPGEVKRFSPPAGEHVKIPHMGWNEVCFEHAHPVFAGIPAGAEFYFVHSYYVTTPKPEHVMAVTEYAGVRFCSSAGRGNVLACQFHPEKSGEAGLRVLKNFLQWDGQPC